MLVLTLFLLEVQAGYYTLKAYENPGRSLH